MYQCKSGHLAISKHYQDRTTEKKNPLVTYDFDVEKCKICPYMEGCYKNGAKRKTYSETLMSDTHSKQAEFQETEYFKDNAKEWYKIEVKNS